MANEIEKVSWRNRARPRRSPYWRLYTTGRYLGWRKMAAGSAGTWLAKAWDGEKYPQKALGDFADKAEEDRYDAALAEATRWFHDHLDKGGTTEAINVKKACENYIDKLRTDRRERAAHDADGRLRRLVHGDPLGKLQLAKLKPADLASWKKRVLAAGGAASSFNRNTNTLRAVLNLAYSRRDVASNFAWAEELKPLEGAAARRTQYLNPQQRRLLVEKASEEARPLFAVLNMLPLRVGEVASLRVEHLKLHQRTLEIPVGKVEPRTIPLTTEALAHFKACARGKLPSAWLVARADGSQWRKEAWRDEIKAAARKAKLPRQTVAYTLRHSIITDLVTGGLDLFTVAKVSGTSVLMIEKHYGHLQQEHARTALEKLALA